ncbi:MAG: hypothetical protein JWQ43_2420 [Glaciihabitans sp.]|nr:hypothetical protein [Glaciihabitans sp.]
MSGSSPSVGPAVPLTPAEDKQWASFAHFGGVLLFIPSLVIFLVFKDRGNLTRQEAKEALNFQITYAIAAVALSIVVQILGTILFFAGAGGLSSLLGNLPFLLYLANVVFSIIAGIRVNGGGTYRYPFALRLIK